MMDEAGWDWMTLAEAGGGCMRQDEAPWGGGVQLARMWDLGWRRLAEAG
jgi:hypothetical protein